jgi:hypothetical protein
MDNQPCAMLMNRSHFNISICLFFTLCFSVVCKVVIGDTATLDEVQSKWINREQQTRTWDVAWENVEFRAVSAQLDPETLEVTTTPETVFKDEGRFVLDQAGRIRFDAGSISWSKEKNAFVPSQVQQVYDGQARTLFFPHGSNQFPNAHITGDSSEIMGRDIRILAFRLVYRTLDSSIGVFDNERPLRVNGKAVIDGKNCVIIEQSPSVTSQLRTRVYADVHRDFLPLRYESHAGKDPVQEVEILEWAENSEVGWVPTKWSVVRSFDGEGKAVWSDTARVTSFKFNLPIENDLFTIDFPVGTWVSNRLTNERYIVKEGGINRPILRGEYNGKNYDEILSTKPGGAGGGNISASSPSAWLIWFNVAVVLVIAIIVVRRYLFVAD